MNIQSLICCSSFYRTTRFHVLIGSVILVFLGLCMGESLAAEGNISKATVSIKAQNGGVHGTASFIGDRGYLLTAFERSSDLPTIGMKFLITNDQIKAVTAAVVDVNHATGISLLRLTDTTYPYDKPLLTSENMKLPFDLKNNYPCKVSFALAVPPYIDNKGCEIIASSEDGTIRINLIPSFKMSNAGMGAPVYADDKLIGLVYKAEDQGGSANVYPINHAISYLMMAEGTILGKDTLLRIVEQAGLVGELQNFLENVRMHPRVQIKIESDPLDLVALPQTPYGIEYLPISITAEAYPTWSFPYKGIQTRVTWSESKMLKISDDLGKVLDNPAVVLRYSYLDGKKSKDGYGSLCEVKLRLLKAKRFAGLDDKYSNSMQTTKVESFHVSYSWEVRSSKSGKTATYTDDGTFPVEDVYCPPK